MLSNSCSENISVKWPTLHQSLSIFFCILACSRPDVYAGDYGARNWRGLVCFINLFCFEPARWMTEHVVSYPVKKLSPVGLAQLYVGFETIRAIPHGRLGRSQRQPMYSVGVVSNWHKLERVYCSGGEMTHTYAIRKEVYTGWCKSPLKI